ncbi:Hypothetical predicted protein [Marmota monax]|uniref:glyceraldehyde-3-phosphate dehydrogenase (phosphorylating) n=1 Tax=Marmota monax TaxID=9995 RepID=A0A5E4BF50_MARMO|nr:Hypothetical predicted protein [Marmota monax]
MNGPCGELWCDDHRPSQNMTPMPAGIAKAADQVIPELNGKLTGMAFCVSCPDVLVMDLTCLLEKAAKHDNMRQELEVSLKDILDYPKDQVVS